MGGNPILYNDVFGDIWGKPGDNKDNKDKEQADVLKGEFSTKRDEYKKTYETLDAMCADFKGDKSKPEFTDLYNQRQEAYNGMIEMGNAIKEIDDIDADKNYYTFKPTLIQEIARPNLMTALDNKDGTFTVNINYNWGSQANKVHETRHAADIARGLSAPVFNAGSRRTNKFSGASESNAYARQYFYDKASMPIEISTFKELYPISNYLEKINDKFGRKVY
jgi:hypothetical protein